MPNEPVNLYYYDLDQTSTRPDPVTGRLSVLDERGNHLCYADPNTGMAYVYDDYGRMPAYTTDEEGNKELVKSIQVWMTEPEADRPFMRTRARKMMKMDCRYTIRAETWSQRKNPG